MENTDNRELLLILVIDTYFQLIDCLIHNLYFVIFVLENNWHISVKGLVYSSWSKVNHTVKTYLSDYLVSLH